MESEVMYAKEKIGRSKLVNKPNQSIVILIAISVGIVFGFLIGVSIHTLPLTKINVTSVVLHGSANIGNKSNANENQIVKDIRKIWVPTNPRGAERLPTGIVASESDLYIRRLWGLPREDLARKPKYLVAFTVGYDLRNNIDKAVKKFSDDFTILLFHYDGRTNEWDDFEWSKRAIHISARKQTKWWYAKRFLHPDIVAPYDYIFIWDEDLGVEHFDAEEYIKLVKKYGLEISQPGLEPFKNMPWRMTRRLVNSEVHKRTEERPGWCSDPHLPPCAAYGDTTIWGYITKSTREVWHNYKNNQFVEIMAPVFSRDAWRCVWHMIQNDLVHGWGLDFALQKCVEPAHEKIGVVDAQWIVHQTVPSLGNQGEEDHGKSPRQAVRIRCNREWNMFKSRMDNAEKAYYKSVGIDPSNFTGQFIAKTR